MSCKTIKERVDNMLSIPNSAGEDISIGSPYQIFGTMVAIETKEECENSVKTLNNAFASTADEYNLEQIGIGYVQPRIEATYSIGQISITGAQGRVISDGSKCFRSSDNFYYTIQTGGTIGLIPLVVDIIADEKGIEGNSTVGIIDRLEDMSNVSLVSNTVKIDNGTNKEDLEIYRERVQRFQKRPRRSGNEAHYEEWAEEVEGIKIAKAFAVWDGDGTVKVTAIDENSEPITEPKRVEMHDYILSRVPISAILTTTVPIELTINTFMTIVIADGWDLPTATINIETEIDKYLKEQIAFKRNEIFYLDLAAIINETESVKSLATLTVNGGTGTVIISQESVAVRGTTNVMEV